MFDFRNLPLSLNACNQLGGIVGSLESAPKQRTRLLNQLILPNRFDECRGFYVPLGEHVGIVAKLTEDFSAVPSAVLPAVGTSFQFFTNALLIPKGFGESNFDIEAAASPKLRVTNAGWLVVTHEFDCTTIDGFEEILSWTRSTGAFDALDKRLIRYRDYRGYCVVYSGDRSLHFNFIFDTRHLEAADFSAIQQSRAERPETDSALMCNVHDHYWDIVGELIQDILKPSLVKTDQQMRSVVQWRRLPWGNRTHQENSKLFDLPAGTSINQIVVNEHIRKRAAKDASDWIVGPGFSLANPIFKKKGVLDKSYGSPTQLMLDEFRQACRVEWGPFPRPASIDNRNGEWVIQFYNHERDSKPSTVVRGEHRKLLLLGDHQYTKEFFLPDHMTAQEWGNHLNRRSGFEPAQQDESQKSTDVETASLSQKMTKRLVGSFPIPIGDIAVSDLQSKHRAKLRAVVGDARMFKFNYIINSGEGIGKTTAHFNLLADEAFDVALESVPVDVKQRFHCFASRSTAQAEEKAVEYRRVAGKYRGAMVLRSFWSHYEDVCLKHNVQSIPRSNFPDHSPNTVLQRIKSQQPAVFDDLEVIRKNLWSDCSRFDAGSTLLFTSHATAMNWHKTQLTRIWHHPEFCPFDEAQDLKKLRNDFIFSEVVFDDAEIDEFLHIIPADIYRHLKEHHVWYPDWRNMSRTSREDVFRQTKAEHRQTNFDEYDELMRIDLDTLEEIKVDFEKIPFGNDNSPSGIYKRRDGEKYYLGHKAWLFDSGTHWAFLTTEQLVTDVIEAIHKRKKRKLFRFDADDLTGIYPIKIPVVIDGRAAADREGKDKVTALAQEITQTNPNAIVISDGVDQVDRVLSFQRMKGANDLADKDISVVLTNIAPEQFARLNVVGQWLNMPDIITVYYQGLINQAVGRNTGFRQRPGTETQVVASRRLWNTVLSKLSAGGKPRVLLYRGAMHPR